MSRTALVTSLLLVGLLGARANTQERIYRYMHVDVFTDEVLSGNQLAVFLDPAGLSDEEMLLIAREMAFSETTFIYPAETEGVDFRVRIFTPIRELPFAGHPTIGTAYALARSGRIEAGTKEIVLGEGIGPVRVELEWEGEELAFAWMHQRAPTFGRRVKDVASIAAALGVPASAIESTGLPIEEVDCGSTFLFVPMATRPDVDRVVLDQTAMARVLEAAGIGRRGIFIFSPEPADDDAVAYSRMLGAREDPATGSATGPLASYLVHHGVVPKDEASRFVGRQGVHMGRPSRLYMSIGLEDDVIKTVRVGGSNAYVGEGTVQLSSR